MSDVEAELNHGDLFSFIDERTARHIAGVCGKIGVGKCTCGAIGDIVRKANGHPQFDDEREAGRQEVLDKVIPVALKTGHAVKITVRELLAAMVEDDQRERLEG